MVTKTKNKKNDNFTKKRIIGSQCIIIADETKPQSTPYLLYKKFIQLSFYKMDHLSIKIYVRSCIRTDHVLAGNSILENIRRLKYRVKKTNKVARYLADILKVTLSKIYKIYWISVE
ncbi:hypothetical protein [Bartonella sp. CB178]|uniref:hypothetical protein n=1 Tax=Bartonella sp. CB178 TaxID=3112255 RepID=UPI00300DD407